VRSKIKERLAQQIDSGTVDKMIFEEALKELEVESYKKFLRSDEYAGYVSYQYSILFTPIYHIPYYIFHPVLISYQASWPTRESSCAPQAPSAVSPSQSSSRRSHAEAPHSASARRSTRPTALSLSRDPSATLVTNSPQWKSATRLWTLLLKYLPLLPAYYRSSYLLRNQFTNLWIELCPPFFLPLSIYMPHR
jgi:hypothetical protein